MGLQAPRSLPLARDCQHDIFVYVALVVIDFGRKMLSPLSPLIHIYRSLPPDPVCAVNGFIPRFLLFFFLLEQS